MPDLKKLLDYRRTKDKDLIAEIVSPATGDPDHRVDVLIDAGGLIHIGTKSLGLDAVKTILEIAQISEFRVKFTIDTANPTLSFIDRNKFCMCYNYKRNLNESKVLIEFDLKYCDVFLKYQKGGKAKLQQVDGLILVDKRYVGVTEEEFHAFVDIEINEGKMQKRALHRAHQLFRDPSIFISIEETVPEEGALREWPSR